MFEDFSTIKLRDCTKCIHHISGNCTKWDCEMETLEQFKQRVQAETIDKCLKALCEHCCTEEDDTPCEKHCGTYKAIEQVKESE